MHDPEVSVPLSADDRKRERQLANLRNAPAAPEGNGRAMTHGGYSDVARERLDEQTRRVFDELAADAPLRDHAGELPSPDHLLVELLARALCRLDTVSTFLTLHGLIDAKGLPRPALNIERRLRLEAAAYARDLGMSPRARVAIGLDLVRAETAQRELAEPRPGDTVAAANAAHNFLRAVRRPEDEPPTEDPT